MRDNSSKPPIASPTCAYLCHGDVFETNVGSISFQFRPLLARTPFSWGSVRNELGSVVVSIPPLLARIPFVLGGAFETNLGYISF